MPIGKYERNLNTINTNVFREEYYSGTDVKVLLDEEDLEIESIQFTIQEQQKPIYGYASRTFDAVSVGSRIVFGTLRVPVKNEQTNNTTLTQVEQVDSDQFIDINHRVASVTYTDPNNPSTKTIRSIGNLKTDSSYSDISGRNMDVINSTNPNIADNPSVPAWIHYLQNEDANYTNREQTSITKYINKEAKLNQESQNKTNNDTSYVFEYRVPILYDERLKPLQESLIKLGYNVDVNGYYDLKTFLAIKQLQSDKHLTVTGNIDNETYAFLSTSEYPKSGFVNNYYGDTLKTGPFSDSPVCSDTVPYKNMITILGTTDKYYKVELSNGKIGYIAKESVAVNG